jgi:hypothetical protein
MTGRLLPMIGGKPPEGRRLPVKPLSASGYERGDPLFGVTGHGDKRLEVIEPERGAVAPLTGLNLEWS